MPLMFVKLPVRKTIKVKSFLIGKRPLLKFDDCDLGKPANW